MKTKLFAGTLLATMMTLGMSQAVVAGPPGHASGGGGGNGSDESCETVHAHACATELNLVRMAITSSTSLNPNVEEKLEVKACSADLKLHISKPGDAQLKLDDLQATVEALRDAPKEKISDTDAATILGDIDDAYTCITDKWASF